MGKGGNQTTAAKERCILSGQSAWGYSGVDAKGNRAVAGVAEQRVPLRGQRRRERLTRDSKRVRPWLSGDPVFWQVCEPSLWL